MLLDSYYYKLSQQPRDAESLSIFRIEIKYCRRIGKHRKPIDIKSISIFH